MAAKEVNVGAYSWSMSGGRAARPRPTAEQTGTDIVRVQPTAKQFAPPNQPDVSVGDGYIDHLYRQLIGPPPATSSGSRSGTRLQPPPKR
jgi:hypothetical protein